MTTKELIHQLGWAAVNTAFNASVRAHGSDDPKEAFLAQAERESDPERAKIWYRLADNLGGVAVELDMHETRSTQLRLNPWMS